MEEIVELLKEQNDLLRRLVSEIKKEPIELTIDSENLDEKLKVTDQSYISQAKRRLSGL